MNIPYMLYLHNFLNPKVSVLDSIKIYDITENRTHKLHFYFFREKLFLYIFLKFPNPQFTATNKCESI